MDNSKKNEQVENEKFVLVMEEFNQEQQALNKTINDLVAQVNTLSNKTEAIKKELDKPKSISVNTDTKPFEKMVQQGFLAIKQSIPDIITVQHHHHFNERSKGFIISAIILLLVTAGATGLCLSLWSENKLLHENALKYHMVRQINPRIARLTDSIYYNDPDEAEQATEKAEASEQDTKQPEINVREKQGKEAVKKKYGRRK